MEIGKVHHRNLSEEVFELLKEKIIRWDFKPGQRLKDRELAEGLGVSRSLVRYAFALLEKEGLVTVSRTGVYVAQFTKKEIQKIFEVRKLLEPFALESAFTNITQKELDDTDEKMKRAERELKGGRLEASYDADVALHQLIINRCNNNQIKKIYSGFRNILGIIILSDYSQRAKVVQFFEEHRQIFDAIKRGDLMDSKKVLVSHLSNAMHRVLENFEKTIVNSKVRGEEIN